MSIIILQFIIENVACIRNILPPMNFCKESRSTSRDNTIIGILLQSSCNGTMFSVCFTQIGNAMPTLFIYDPMDLATKKLKFLLISFQHENVLLILESVKKSAYILLQGKHVHYHLTVHHGKCSMYRNHPFSNE